MHPCAMKGTDEFVWITLPVWQPIYTALMAACVGLLFLYCKLCAKKSITVDSKRKTSNLTTKKTVDSACLKIAGADQTFRLQNTVGAEHKWKNVEKAEVKQREVAGAEVMRKEAKEAMLKKTEEARRKHEVVGENEHKHKVVEENELKCKVVEEYKRKVALATERKGRTTEKT